MVNKEAVDSVLSMKPKPKPRPRKSHSPNSSPSIKPANPPFQKQPTASNQYVELCADSGTRVEDDSTPSDATTTSAPAVDVMSSLNQLVAGSMTQSESSESGSTVVGPEDLAQSFTSSQLQLLINMLQKVQTVQGSNGEAGSGEGEGGGGGEGMAAAKTGGGGSKAQTPVSPPGPLYEVEDTAHNHLALKGNFSKLISAHILMCIHV